MGPGFASGAIWDFLEFFEKLIRFGEFVQIGLFKSFISVSMDFLFSKKSNHLKNLKPKKIKNRIF